MVRLGETPVAGVAGVALAGLVAVTGACGPRGASPGDADGSGGSTSAGAGGTAAGVGASAGATASGGTSPSGGSGGTSPSGGTAGNGGSTAGDIPVRYVMLSSADRASWESRFPEWVDCTDPTIEADQTARCMPGATLGRFNDDFESLTSTRPFGRASFEVVERSPFASLLTQHGEVNVCGAGTVTSAIDGSALDAASFAIPGTFTVIVVEEIEDPVGGFALVDQPVNPSSGAWIVLEARAPFYASQHELGHAFGLEHFMHAPQSYDHCGGMSVDPNGEKTGCTCEYNVMGLLLWTVDADCTCHQAPAPPPTFDTPMAADFAQHVARCWLDERRHRQECIAEFSEGSTICAGTEGNVTCHCPDAQSTFTTRSCSPEGAAQLRADAIEHCSRECFPSEGGASYPRCQGSPYEVTCECSEGGPTFTAPGCSDQYADVIRSAATEACGLARCTSTLVPGVVCEGIAFDTITCTCPNGAEFQTASDCSVLELFVEGFCAG